MELVTAEKEGETGRLKQGHSPLRKTKGMFTGLLSGVVALFLVGATQGYEGIENFLNVTRFGAGEIFGEGFGGRWRGGGIGGAKLLIVDGNYPIDYSILKERGFASEDAACDEAERYLM